MNKDVGRNAERELVGLLRNHGFKAVRIPTSNSSPNPLPDVFAVHWGTLYAFEVKSTWDFKVKVRKLQVEKLLGFLSIFPLPGEAYIAVKFKSVREWRHVRVEKPQDVVVTVESSIPIKVLLGAQPLISGNPLGLYANHPLSEVPQ